MFSPIFVADTKTIFFYYFVAFLKAVLSKEVDLTLLPTFKEQLNHGKYNFIQLLDNILKLG